MLAPWKYAPEVRLVQQQVRLPLSGYDGHALHDHHILHQPIYTAPPSHWHTVHHITLHQCGSQRGNQHASVTSGAWEWRSTCSMISFGSHLVAPSATGCIRPGLPLNISGLSGKLQTKFQTTKGDTHLWTENALETESVVQTQLLECARGRTLQCVANHDALTTAPVGAQGDSWWFFERNLKAPGLGGQILFAVGYRICS